MEISKPDTGLVRAGFVLFTLALLTGFAIPAFHNQRMALAAHVGGILNALVLIALGLAWGMLHAGTLQTKLTRAAFLFATFGNWATACLAAAWGTNHLTPMSGAGFGAAPQKELVVQVLQVLVTTVIVIGSVSVVHALRPRAGAD